MEPDQLPIRPPMMVDGPSWLHRGDGTAARVLARGAARFTAKAAFDRVSGLWQLAATAPVAERLATFRVADLAESTPPAIRRNLARLDGLQRYGAGSCWEALGTAIVRQVITAAQARRVWHRLAQLVAGSPGRFPTEAELLAASDADLAATGLGFKLGTLRSVAEACLSEQRSWERLGSAELCQAWLRLPGVGPWSAGAAIADLRHAWHLYPHDDLAVRTWAARAFPELGIPAEPKAFLRLWTDWGGGRLGTLTVLTLGWSATSAG